MSREVEKYEQKCNTGAGKQQSRRRRMCLCVCVYDEGGKEKNSKIEIVRLAYAARYRFTQQ